MSRFKTMLAQALATRSTRGVVNRWINSLDEDDRKEFLQAVNDPSTPSTIIAHVMHQLGYNGGNSTFYRWRNTQCLK